MYVSFIFNLLKRYDFFRARTPQRFRARNWEVYFTRDFVGNVTNWFITDSDADGDAWSVDSLDAW